MVWLIESSRLNFAFTAIRENEEVANVMGIDPTRYKVLAFMISAFFTGFHQAVFTAITTPILFPPRYRGCGLSIACLVMPILGGSIPLPDPILGTILIKAIEEFLQVTFSYGHQICVRPHSGRGGARPRGLDWTLEEEDPAPLSMERQMIP